MPPSGQSEAARAAARPQGHEAGVAADELLRSRRPPPARSRTRQSTAAWFRAGRGCRRRAARVHGVAVAETLQRVQADRRRGDRPAVGAAPAVEPRCAAAASTAGAPAPMSMRANGLSMPLNSSHRQEQLVRRQQRALAGRRAAGVARLGVLPEALDRGRHVAVQAQRSRRRQVVGKSRGALEEQRQVVLDAARRDAVADVLVERRLRRVALEHFAEAAAEAGARRFVQRKFARRQQAHSGTG